jgi:hypothetical protein
MSDEEDTDSKVELIPLAPSDPPQENAGTECDMKKGPCACGAWH